MEKVTFKLRRHFYRKTRGATSTLKLKFSRNLLSFTLIGFFASGCVMRGSNQKNDSLLKGTTQYTEQPKEAREKEIEKRVGELGYDKADIVDAATDWLIKNKEDSIPYLILALDKDKYKLSTSEKVVTRFGLFSLGVLAIDPAIMLYSLSAEFDHPEDLIYKRVYDILRYKLKEEAIPFLEKVKDDTKTSKQLKRKVQELLIQIHYDSRSRNPEGGNRKKLKYLPIYKREPKWGQFET